MPTNDLYYIIQWWSVLFVIGIIFFPLTSFLFRPFYDKGYAFSKILGTILTSYLVFVLGVIKLAPFNTLTIGTVLLVSSVVSIIFIIKNKSRALRFIMKSWGVLLFTEILFFTAIFAWSYVRGFNPEVYGLEKYMDFGFMNSILRTEHFPPKDMWFTPLSINYYYFGHLISAVLTKISFLSPYITYNLMLATIFAFCLTQVFSIASTLWYQFTKEHSTNNDQPVTRLAKKTIATTGLLTAFLTTLAGNLHIVHGFFKAYPNDKPAPLWQLEFLPSSFPNSYWYPNATRFIYNTIHEFPIYSWVVADLHGHVLDIPHVLLTIAFLLSFLLTYNKQHSRLKSDIPNLMFIGFLLAIMYMTNAWDGGIYLLLSIFICLYLTIQSTHPSKEPEHKVNKRKILEYIRTQHLSLNLLGIKIKIYFLKLLSYTLLIMGSFFVITLPFNTYFNPTQIVSGVGVLCSPKFLTDFQTTKRLADGTEITEKGKIGPFLFESEHCQKSPIWQIITLYGFFYIFVLLFIIFLQRVKKLTRSDIFVCLLVALSSLLIILPELFYMKDIYPAHYRANTMFKLVFQAFIMLSISTGYIIFRVLFILKDSKNKAAKMFSIGYIFAVIFLLTLVFTYPVLAIRSYYNNLQSYKGLDGFRYLQVRYPTDYQAILWLNKHIKGQPVILEAQGDSYTDYARVSANTGLPTVLGWTVHEWLWRGTYDVPAPRITDIQTLYETPDILHTKELLKKYKVEYVMVGSLEKEKYPSINENKFNQLGDTVFQSGNTTIYKLRPF